MTDTDLMERAALAAHNAWWAAKKAAGFHAPEECPCREEHVWASDRAGGVFASDTSVCARCGTGWNRREVNGVTVATCRWCHRDMRPYADLEEPTKELDRSYMRAVHGVYAKALQRLREIVEDYAQHRPTCGIAGRGCDCGLTERLGVAVFTTTEGRGSP